MRNKTVDTLIRASRAKEYGIPLTGRRLRQLAAGGMVPAYRLPTGGWLFNPGELRRWLESGRVAPDGWDDDDREGAAE